MRRTIDIQVKGELAKYMVELLGRGQVRECKNLHLDQWPNRNHSVVCSENWAKQISADSSIEFTGYHVPSSYTFPQCPDDCPHFEKTNHFLKSVGRDQIDIQNTRRKDTSALEPAQIKPAGKVIRVPDKITADWIWKNAHWSVWLLLWSALIATAGLGFAVGRWTAQFERDHAASSTAPATAANAQEIAPSASTKATTKK